MAYASIARTFWGNSASASSTSPVASSSPVASVGASSPAVYAGLQDGMEFLFGLENLKRHQVGQGGRRTAALRCAVLC